MPYEPDDEDRTPVDDAMEWIGATLLLIAMAGTILGVVVLIASMLR